MHHDHPIASAQDIEDADDVLFAHPARRVTRWRCDCGDDYPCPEVRFALLVKHARVGVRDDGPAG
ncbi:hypothetical protein ACFY3U_05930 [Micromonospora sp. NPDC000089]|uniref:hypothetical protein n=1 Tax=unclassified Micromonospora TaxID=2617518 RepID=UPI0036BAB7F3